MIAIVLNNPKTPFNVGSAIRAASCYGAEEVWWTGQRVTDDRNSDAMRGSKLGKRKWRLPREERMKAYDIAWGVDDDALRKLIARDFTPVCVELVEGAENLAFFDHPEEDTVYVFGPEDGSVPKGVRHACHRIVQIPTIHCINLGAAVYTVLYDRTAKSLTRETVLT